MIDTELLEKPVAPGALSVTEAAALMECESLIRDGRGEMASGGIKMGRGLARILRSKLYRSAYRTFEDYCQEEWDLSARYARNLMTAAEITGVLEDHHFPLLPATESQARPLCKLSREQWVPAWMEVMEESKASKLTAALVAEVVQRRLGKAESGGSATGKAESENEEAAGETSNIQHPTSNIEGVAIQTLSTAAAPLPSSIFHLPSSKPIDVPDLTTRERRIQAQAVRTLGEVRKLKSDIGTFDAAAQTGVVLAEQFLIKLLDHAEQLEREKQEKAMAAEARGEEGLKVAAVERVL